MATEVSVLCARVRVEEKWLIGTLADAGIPARPLPPTVTPLPVGPVPSGPLATTVAGGVADEVSGIVVDRCADRVVARAVIRMLRAMGVKVIDGGLAATSDRLAIASALAACGIPRPTTLLITSEDSGIAAANRLGYPATLLPLDPGSPEIPLFDRDIAEAVLEHREVLGNSVNAVSLIQAGPRPVTAGSDVLVVAGRAVAVRGGDKGTAPTSARAIELAEAAAVALGAAILGVTVSDGADGPVVWDVTALPEFRGLLASDGATIAGAVLGLIQALEQLEGDTIAPAPHASEFLLGAAIEREVANGVILSA